MDNNGHNGLGFTFESYNADDFRGALQRCLDLYHHRRADFIALQKKDMEQDFSWDKPAQKYMDIFYYMRNNL